MLKKKEKVIDNSLSIQNWVSNSEIELGPGFQLKRYIDNFRIFKNRQIENSCVEHVFFGGSN